MAYVSSQRATGFRLSTLVETVKTAITRRMTYAKTVAELDALSDRELADMGMHRSQIAQIAHQAAFGK
ncbi:DUF1127 domain-containing protein [Gemmobacter denitrificans]|uniref:DUF1127 domain-containing protein n=1 Tax=Gemmobacter denitrificans TaxID=3123040 RepID=A0ABU8BTL9_9RHOB